MNRSGIGCDILISIYHRVIDNLGSVSICLDYSLNSCFLGGVLHRGQELFRSEKYYEQPTEKSMGRNAKELFRLDRPQVDEAEGEDQGP